MKRFLLAVVKYFLICVLVLYAADWLIWQIRAERHTGSGNVQVQQFLGTPLKGQKEEYDFLGTVDENLHPFDLSPRLQFTLLVGGKASNRVGKVGLAARSSPARGLLGTMSMSGPARSGMLLELGKFASLLLSVLCLCALFHTAFLMPTNTFEDRALSLLQMLMITAGVSWASGWIFYYEERRTGATRAGVATTFPMMVFWWTAAIILGLFLFAWFLQVYFLPPFGVLRH